MVGQGEKVKKSFTSIAIIVEAVRENSNKWWTRETNNGKYLNFVMIWTKKMLEVLL